MQRALLVLILAALLTASACQRIQEPWIQDDNPLDQERARSPEDHEALRHRFMWVQTDR